jgi:chemosensory pili system protein ChpB (putative protein-glutamate methylesterase)
MPETTRPSLRVALLAEDVERAAFRALLQDEGMEVVLDGRPGASLPGDWRGADVLLVEVGDRCGRERIEGLLRQSPVPVLLNTGGVGNGAAWQLRLVAKLRALAARATRSAAGNAAAMQPGVRPAPGGPQADACGNPWLVVLGASIGGPRAVTRFLQALPTDLPVAFLLAQHISEAFQDLLVEQLDRCSDWPVALLGDTQTVEPGHVWMVPVEHRILLDDSGVIRRSDQSWRTLQRPAIDAIVETVAGIFGSRCGVILFSGLGKDGASGCNAVARHGGFVWAQSPESCVVRHMPDAARRSCQVELSGSPEQLAGALAERCRPVRHLSPI